MSTDKKPATHRFQPLPTGKKVFDVVRPGRALPPANSRSVLMTNQPDATDGQFVTPPPSAPALPGAPGKNIKHPLTTSKEAAVPKPVQETEPTPPPAARTEEQVSPEQPEPSEAQERPAKVPSVVMLSAIDAALGDEPEIEINEPQAPPQERPATSRRVNVRVEQEVAVAAVAESPAEPEADIEPEEAEPSQSKAAAAVTVQTDVSQSLAKPLTEEEIAAHLSHEDLLADTNAPDVDHQMVVSHHRHRMRVWQFILIFLLIVILALVAFNFLLDAGIVKTELDIPHTNLLQ